MQQVKCDFLVTMLERDGSLGLFAGGVCGNSRVFDFSGNEFVAEAAYIGTERSACSIYHQMVAGIPLKAGWIIGGVPAEVSTLSAADFGINTSYSGNLRLQLRAIPVLK